MTTLRFTGNLPFGLPWWVGLILAVVVAILSWTAYNRERYDIPQRLRWFLPLLRSTAFFLGVLILTGPVLHHRTTIGELGKVRIYLDSSGSMTMQDRHMSVGRKLLIAEQLGWLSEGRIDRSLLFAADRLAGVGSQLATFRTNGVAPGAAIDVTRPTETSPAASEKDVPDLAEDPAVLRERLSQILASVNELQNELPAEVRQTFVTTVFEPLQAATQDQTSDAKQLIVYAAEAETAVAKIETNLRAEFEKTVNSLISAGDDSVESALTLFDETARWRRAELGLNDTTSRIIETLRTRHDVDVYTLAGDEAVLHAKPDTAVRSDESEVFATTEASEAGTRQTFSGVTDLSSGITASQRGVVAAAAGESSAGQVQTAVVLVTDGQHNSGPSPIQSARVLGNQGIPFYCLSVGASEEAQDLAVLELDYPDTVFQQDRVRGQMTIRDRMKPGRPFVAEIRHGDEVLWQEQLVTTGAAERRVEFEFAIDELVDRLGSQFETELKQHTLPLQFEAAIAPLAEETETSNNQQAIRLAAITESYRLLILDGRSRWETRYLRNVFERDEQWSVNTIIAGAGTDAPELPRGEDEGDFPAEREDLFDYDLVIFGEISAELFAAHEFEWLSEFVELRGGGMVFVDGQRKRLPELAENPLGTLIPVEWVPEDSDGRTTTMQLTQKGASQPFLKLKSDDEQNRQFWTQLPPPRSVVAVNPLPGAEVLIETTQNENPRPLMVTRTYGAGKVVYLATDETWRWRYKTADEWHQRIWNQIAKYAMPRPFAVSDEFVSVDTGAISYDYGDNVDIRVRLTDLEGKPTSEATADAIVWKDGRIVSTINLVADKEVPGIYRGRTGGLPEGEYEVSVRASGYSEAALKARSSFDVLPPETGEMSTTSANEALLKQIAEASSGLFLREEDAAMLPELLDPLSSGRVVESDTLLWQSYWWFAAIILLLTVEWALRKRSGLL